MLQTICILNDFSSVFGPSNVNVMGASNRMSGQAGGQKEHSEDGSDHDGR